MGRLGLDRCDIWYDISRLRRKRAHSWNKESESENSDIFRFKRQIRKTKNMDEDYVQYLMLLLDYDEESKCYTNEGANEGPAIVGDRLNHDVDEDGNEYEDDEDEDEDEDDPEYKRFLANAKSNGNSIVAKIDSSDGFPVFVEFEKENGSDEEYEYLGRRKQHHSGEEKDLGNISSKDKVESQPFSRIVLENDDNRSAGDNNVIIEPCGPVTEKEKELTIQKLSLGENGACKRRRKGETKNRSNKEQKKGKGRRSAKVTTKEEGADVDEDYSVLLEKFICKNWRTPTSFKNKYNLKTKKSSMTVLENDSNISVGDIDMTHEPSDPPSPKEKRKRGRPRKKNSTKGDDASKRQGKGEKRKRSNEKQTARKGRKLAVVPFNEDEAGRKSVNDTVKEEIADVDEASFKTGHRFECEAADEDLQIVVNDNCTFGKEGNSNLVEASSAKHCENVEDSCPRTAHSDFWWNVKALLERPYNQKEYIGLWKAVKSRKPTLKNMDLRNGKFYASRQLGKSYLDHYKDLHEKLKEVDSDSIKKLNILRAFFFWLQNLTQAGAFRPWTDPEWLSLVDNSIVPTLTSNE